MNEWVKSIVGYLLIVSVAMQMMPNQKYAQYIRLFTGFLLIILILQPVLKIRSADSFLEQQISEFIEEQEKLETGIGVLGEAFREKSEQMQEDAQENIDVKEIEKVRVEVTVDD